MENNSRLANIRQYYRYVECCSISTQCYLTPSFKIQPYCGVKLLLSVIKGNMNYKIGHYIYLNQFIGGFF